MLTSFVGCVVKRTYPIFKTKMLINKSEAELGVKILCGKIMESQYSNKCK